MRRIASRVEHVAHFPCTLGDKTFNGVGQRVHTGGGGERRGHGGHHIGVDDGNLWDVVSVNADELALLLNIGDNVVDGDFSRVLGGRRDGDGEDGVLLGGGDALEGRTSANSGLFIMTPTALCSVHDGARRRRRRCSQHRRP